MVEASPEKQRGREHGYDIDDWQRAEAEIVGKKQQPADVQAAPAEHPAMAVTMKPLGFRTIVLAARPNAAAQRKERTHRE